MNTGLLALNGIPGSGKTLDAVDIALRHYKNENRLLKYYYSILKYYVCEFLNKITFIKKIKELFNKLKDILFFKLLFWGLYYFFNLFLLLFLFVSCTIYFKMFVVIYLLYHKKFFISLNSIDYKYYKLFPYRKINNVYSSFPILLDKKRNIWSNSVTVFDLDGSKSFYPNCLIIIDEIQLFIDSDEFRDKNKKKVIDKIGKFLQSHRHFGIKQIIFTSQSPTRIFKKARNIIIAYLKQERIINLPFSISIMRGIMYYDFEFYGRYIPKSREERKKLPFDYKRVIKVFIRNKVYNSYDSRYLSLYNYQKPLCNRGTWLDYKVSYEYLEMLFDKNDF